LRADKDWKKAMANAASSLGSCIPTNEAPNAAVISNKTDLRSGWLNEGCGSERGEEHCGFDSSHLASPWCAGCACLTNGLIRGQLI
jgi:hypothetical protein